MEATVTVHTYPTSNDIVASPDPPTGRGQKFHDKHRTDINDDDATSPSNDLNKSNGNNDGLDDDHGGVVLFEGNDDFSTSNKNEDKDDEQTTSDQGYKPNDIIAVARPTDQEPQKDNEVQNNEPSTEDLGQPDSDLAASPSHQCSVPGNIKCRTTGFHHNGQLHVAGHIDLTKEIRDDLNKILKASGIFFTSLLLKTIDGRHVKSKKGRKAKLVLNLFEISPNQILLELWEQFSAAIQKDSPFQIKLKNRITQCKKMEVLPDRTPYPPLLIMDETKGI